MSLATQRSCPNSQLPVKSVSELIALAKAKPGTIAYGSGGVGSGPHLAMELFKSLAEVNLLHVPYNDTSPALNDLMAGRVQVMLLVNSAEPMIRSGTLRALAVTGATSAPGFADPWRKVMYRVTSSALGTASRCPRTRRRSSLRSSTQTSPGFCRRPTSDSAEHIRAGADDEFSRCVRISATGRDHQMDEGRESY